uniref:UTP6 small subunit processome component n=1 Tax=Nothobranchius furzeri TaxID=105023 RepID=A0A8C6LUY8_NOTFU
MAEIVQQRIEDRIPQLEQLERVGLFTQKEVKSIIKKATALEYKLQRLTVNKEDLIAYIQYEINVLELIKKRRAHIHYQFKREEIEFPIIQRINSIFRRATKKWKDDVQLWFSHVAFCKKWATKGQISKVFSSMLAIHPDKPALWIMAAKSELEDRDSSESARHLFLRALRFHPNNKKVYQEYFRMELLHSEKLRKQKEDLDKADLDLFSPEILNGKLAEVVYIDATEKIREAEFVISLLNIASIFDFTKDLQDSILQDLQKNYADDSVTWDFMAKRELEAPGAGEELHTARGRASDIDRREERCCQVYEEGLRSLGTEPMWTCYVAFCLERLKRKTNVQELKEKVSDSFSPFLGRTPRTPSTLNLHVKGQHLPHNLLCSQTGLQSAITTVAMEMKESYLNWSYSTGGYKKARKTFLSLRENRPLSKGLFTRMIEVEKEQETPKINNLRDYYERALQEFGTSDDDLWLQYIQEELGPLGRPENCGKIHWRAMKFLEGESVGRFTSRYTLLQTGHL